MQDFTSTEVHHIENKSIMKVMWGSGMRRPNTEERQREFSGNEILDKDVVCQAYRATSSDCGSGKEGSRERSFRGKES